MIMKKQLRATYILARLMNARPDNGESLESFNTRNNLPRALSVRSLCNKTDVYCGLAYRIAKAFGYQIIFYNPNPPEGLDKMYVVGEDKMSIVPRESKAIHKLRKDNYTSELFRVPKKYKKKRKRITKTFKEVKSNVIKERQ